jgi:hypothetical protein
LEDRAFFAKFADVVKGILTPAVHDKIIADMRAATEDRVAAGTNPAEIVQAVAVRFGMTQGESDGVLTHWFNGGDGMDRFGLANAITRAAQDAPDYDRATELEQIGGDFLTHGRLSEVKPIEVKARRRRAGATAAANGTTVAASIVAASVGVND